VDVQGDVDLKVDPAGEVAEIQSGQLADDLAGRDV
jgi:hypothetical protein